MSSAYNGDLRIFNMLLSRGADLNTFDYQGNTPLHIAAATGNQALTEALVNKGLDINSRNVADAATPLMAAIQNNRLETSRLLVEKGADVNAVNIAGASPLTMAAEKNDAGLVGALIARGADVNYQDSKGQTVLMVAASLASELIIKLLIESGADPRPRNRSGQTALDFYTRGRNYGRYTNDPRGYNRYPDRTVLQLLQR
jgi:ankyrin repeat protein